MSLCIDGVSLDYAYCIWTCDKHEEVTAIVNVNACSAAARAPCLSLFLSLLPDSDSVQ